MALGYQESPLKALLALVLLLGWGWKGSRFARWQMFACSDWFVLPCVVQTDAAKMKYFFNFLCLFSRFSCHGSSAVLNHFNMILQTSQRENGQTLKVLGLGLCLCAQKPLILLCEKQSMGLSFAVSCWAGGLVGWDGCNETWLYL